MDRNTNFGIFFIIYSIINLTAYYLHYFSGIIMGVGFQLLIIIGCILVLLRVYNEKANLIVKILAIFIFGIFLIWLSSNLFLITSDLVEFKPEITTGTITERDRPFDTLFYNVKINNLELSTNLFFKPYLAKEYNYTIEYLPRSRIILNAKSLS